MALMQLSGRLFVRFMREEWVRSYPGSDTAYLLSQDFSHSYKFIPSSRVSQLSQFLSSPEPSPGSCWVQGHSDSWAEGTKAPKSASSLGGAAPEPCARHSGQAARLGVRHRAASLGTGSAEEVARRPPQHPQSGRAPGVTTSPLAGRHFLGRKEVSLRRACLGREGSCL